VGENWNSEDWRTALAQGLEEADFQMRLGADATGGELDLELW